MQHRVFAVALLVVAFVALVLSKAFPGIDLPEPIKIAVAVVGAVCALGGVVLWIRGRSGAGTEGHQDDQA